MIYIIGKQKSTVIHHFIPLRWLSSKDKQQQELASVWRDQVPRILLAGMQNEVASLKNSLEAS